MNLLFETLDTTSELLEPSSVLLLGELANLDLNPTAHLNCGTPCGPDQRDGDEQRTRDEEGQAAFL